MELKKAQSYFFQASTSLIKNQGNANFSEKSTIFLKKQKKSLKAKSGWQYIIF